MCDVESVPEARRNDELERLRGENADIKDAAASLSADVTTISQQRDELLAALEECLAAYSASPKRPPDLVEDWERHLARIDKANRQARAVIAKVKP